MVLSKALEIYDSLMKELNDDISPLTNITLASYALTVFRNLYMPKDTLIVATEEEHKFAQEALHGGKTDVRVLYREWTEQDIKNEVYGSYVDFNPCTLLYNIARTCPLGFVNGRFLRTGRSLNPF